MNKSLSNKGDIAYYFWMPHDLHVKVKVVSANEGRSMKQLLIDACTLYFEAKEANVNAHNVPGKSKDDD